VHTFNGVYSVAVSPDGCLVAAGYDDNLVRLWDVQTGQLVKHLVGHISRVESVAFTPDGKGLVSGSKDGALKHWNLGPLLRSVQREALVQTYQVGVEHAGSVAARKGENEALCLCTVEFLGHKVRVCLHFLCFLCSLLGLIILHYLHRDCFIYFYFFKW
jgi:general transcriptional corepressor TUP1